MVEAASEGVGGLEAVAGDADDDALVAGDAAGRDQLDRRRAAGGGARAGAGGGMIGRLGGTL